MLDAVPRAARFCRPQAAQDVTSESLPAAKCSFALTRTHLLSGSITQWSCMQDVAKAARADRVMRLGCGFEAVVSSGMADPRDRR